MSEIFVDANIIRGSVVAYEIRNVDNRCRRRKFQTLISQIDANDFKFKEFEIFLWKKTRFLLSWDLRLGLLIIG